MSWLLFLETQTRMKAKNINFSDKNLAADYDMCL